MVAAHSDALAALGSLAETGQMRTSDGAHKSEPREAAVFRERSDLTTRYQDRYAATKIIQHENFAQWTHEQIWNALHGASSQVDVAAINTGADGWRRLDEGGRGSAHGGMREAVETFRADVEKAIATHWQGRAATAAMVSTRAYVVEAEKLSLTFELMANCIDTLEDALSKAARSIQPPLDVSGFDQANVAIPRTGAIKESKHSADEAEAEAQWLMSTIYQPAAREVDERTPRLAQAVNTFHGGKTPEPAQPPKNPSTRKSTGEPAENSTQPVDYQQSATRVGSPEETDPAGTRTTPSSTAPTTADPSTTPGSPNPGTAPGTGAPTSGSPTAGPPIAGKAVPGHVAKQAGAPERTANATAGRNGLPGMAGMGAPGARAKGDDDGEHRIPDYLVRDRTTELLGEQPWVLPTGGVIE
ncbi:hypothetical protein FEK33_12435 [Nocardia asteroides NBRC 15531]|uniref:PPE family domain-containing protein n=1 Tax=Nocardia asteroides NBRC 15531 TaxID=1110697 RepID=U5EJI9_NOCAS|nr:hypothetical protein [Nocardia asteroides]TLF66832.1 hypothetical protein FEK33_12435 [Nocardia asteroides NBRC 15531]UGT51923.1 hypothetical protein LT345_15770 [Nocardia asteroides]SFN02261.1 hypothetical protein SAMN05444423_105390 [Nocardia asteroides]VEG35162.1 Uncharacterised protein [Nocardia asteroides]GAD85289.1 hypothetical protein NCAST_30_00590 [Nocardia asteroides NBRC 15531]